MFTSIRISNYFVKGKLRIIGDYRVIFDIEGNELVVLRVGHRPEIYRR
jgi:mRNA-degrading endonuclease RelE of RelBE toxin-antitoxin system